MCVVLSHGVSGKLIILQWIMNAACGSDGKEPACNAGDLDSISVSGRSPGEGMATHSSILAWEIPWTEEPGGLQVRVTKKIRHDLVTINSNNN